MSHWNWSAAVKRSTTREIRISLSHLEGVKLLESWMEDALPLKRKELGNKTSHSSCQNLTIFFLKRTCSHLKKKSRHLYMHVLILVAIKVIPLLLECRDFISSSSSSIIMLMQITLIMCQDEIQEMGLVCTYITKHWKWQFQNLSSTS